MINSLPLYVNLLVGIPEAFLFLLLGFRLFNLELDKRVLVFVSVFDGFFVHFLRQLPIYFGVHVLIVIISLALLIRLFNKHNFLHAFVAVLTGLLIDGVLQSITIPVLFSLTSNNPNVLLTQPWTNIAFFSPNGLLMLIIYFVVKKFNLILYNLKKY